MKPRRTKIIATIGPASDSPAVLKQMIKAGVDLIRLNFSHGTTEDHQRRATTARQMADEAGKIIGIIADLQGPKIRIAKFAAAKVILKVGQRFVLDATLGDNDGDEHQVGIDYKQLPDDLIPGDILLLDDGRLELTVQDIVDRKIICQVIVGGVLSNNKGINRQGGGLSARALTEKDKRDLITAIKLNVEYIAVSFPRSKADILEAKELVKSAGGNAGVIAKIERKEAIENIIEIIDAADAVMVARGDLGVEIGDAALPGIQKKIIQMARHANKPVITATQMMESMIHNTIPTRAEVFDVANAALDATDAVMLSAETATGDYPVKVVEAMSRICLGAEKERVSQMSRHRIDANFARIDEAIAMAAMYTANHLDISAIIALTESGATALKMSRIRSGIPIYALSRHAMARGKMTLYRGVYPLVFDVTKVKFNEVNQAAVKELESRGIVAVGDKVILTKGDYMGVHGGCNAMKILQVGSVL